MIYIQEYSLYLISLFIAACIALLILGLSWLLTESKPDTEKNSPYESGFAEFDDARELVDIKFYIVAILFLLFDLEAMFIYPWIFTLADNTNFYYNFWIMIDFIFELFIGYIYAWQMGALDWH